MTMRPLRMTQRGAALIVALLLLIVITVLSITAMRTSTMQLRMAVNHQERTQAVQTAQAAIDAALGNLANFPVAGGAGYALCTANWDLPGPACNQTTVTLPAVTPFTDSTVVNKVKITRPAPDLAPPPRGVGFSADKFGAAAFDIDSQATVRTGQSEMVQGYLVLVPKFGQ